MMTFAYDRGAAVLVARATGKITDQELREFGRALLKLDTESLNGKRVPATILAVTMAGDRPTAEQRRMMADLWHPIQAPLHLFALVSKSPVARGIFKVVQWLNPPGGRRHEVAHATFAEAVHWVEQQRGERIPSLPGLYEQGTGGQTTTRA
jgi:hypothetical protein